METNVNRDVRATLHAVVIGDERIDCIGVFEEGDTGQAQIIDPDFMWRLHLQGAPTAWRHLARLLEDGAMEVERQLAERDHAGSDVRERIDAMVAESAV